LFQRKVACPTETDLGIQYGKCYVFSFPDGKKLGRQPNRAYEKGGRWQDISFKVCGSTFDCKGSGPVGLKDSFSLQDQIGLPEDSAKRWINSFSGGSYKAFTPIKHRLRSSREGLGVLVMDVPFVGILSPFLIWHHGA
jgi:hypothetical protein